MNPARLQHLLIFERPATVVQDDGSPATTWGEIGRARAELSEQSLSEDERQRGDVSTTDLTFRARFVPDIALSDRVQFNGKPHDIIALAEIGRRAGLEVRVRRTGQ